jgi:hypothetical protein
VITDNAAQQEWDKENAIKVIKWVTICCGHDQRPTSDQNTNQTAAQNILAISLNLDFKKTPQRNYRTAKSAVSKVFGFCTPAITLCWQIVSNCIFMNNLCQRIGFEDLQRVIALSVALQGLFILNLTYTLRSSEPWTRDPANFKSKDSFKKRRKHHITLTA